MQYSYGTKCGLSYTGQYFINNRPEIRPYVDCGNCKKHAVKELESRIDEHQFSHSKEAREDYNKLLEHYRR